MAQAWILFHKNKKDVDVKQKMVALLEQREDLLNENRKIKKAYDEINRREDWLKSKYKDDNNKWANVSKDVINIANLMLNKLTVKDRHYNIDGFIKDISEKINRYN